MRRNEEVHLCGRSAHAPRHALPALWRCANFRGSELEMPQRRGEAAEERESEGET
jgi:hypothetical protein